MTILYAIIFFAEKIWKRKEGEKAGRRDREELKQEKKEEYGKTTEEGEIEMQEGIKKKERKNEEKKIKRLKYLT